MSATGVIGGPREAHHVSTLAEYEAFARAALRGLRPGEAVALVPGETLPAVISGGWWVVQCPCGNAPSASREWNVAICCECGAVHTPLWPKHVELAEKVLLARPLRNRHFFPGGIGGHGPERLAHLILQNREQGLPKRPRPDGVVA